MKPRLSIAFSVLLALAISCVFLRTQKPAQGFDVPRFGEIPVLLNGRIKPIDTVARSTLLMTQGRQRVTSADGRTLTPSEWLLDVMYRRDLADAYQTFEVTNPDLLGVLELTPSEGSGGKRFSANQLNKRLRELDRQASLADSVEAPVRTPFQRAAIKLRDSVLIYQHIQTTLNSAGSVSVLPILVAFDEILPALNNPATSPQGAKLLQLAKELVTIDQTSYFFAIPPAEGATAVSWRSFGSVWTETFATKKIDPQAMLWASIGDSWHRRDPAQFNAVVTALHGSVSASLPAVMSNSRVETRFNFTEPFYVSSILYVAAFLLGVLSWLKWEQACASMAMTLLTTALVITTVGIATRMWLEGRPPVTNLYSSALFVGWGSAVLCVVLEYFFKNAVGSVAGGLVGFATLLIAHHLSLSGDTLEMMRAVLDSNFWLATHVVTVTVGYSATFLAGFLALIYVLRGVFTRSMDAASASAITRMIYGITCFATLFSFVGTVLGGIWADQSWGRFWGWDPKENGALLIVAWNAVILHARWGGLAGPRGIAALAILGNIVTAWSWFGVNMLGVGLHSYGFMDSAFWWLIAFAASQVGVVAIALTPMAKWRSFSAK